LGNSLAFCWSLCLRLCADLVQVENPKLVAAGIISGRVWRIRLLDTSIHHSPDAIYGVCRRFIWLCSPRLPGSTRICTLAEEKIFPRRIKNQGGFFRENCPPTPPPQKLFIHGQPGVCCLSRNTPLESKQVEGFPKRLKQSLSL
jgi:hypothetical protein